MFNVYCTWFFLAEYQLVHCAYKISVNENSYVIVIGIEKYRDIIQAPFAAYDTKAVQDVLTTKRFVVAKW